MANEIKLSEEEATELANELKERMRSGEMPIADNKKVELMIAGLGDSRGLIRRTFAEGLGMVGQPAVAGLRDALLSHTNVIVRRAAAKALKLVGDPSALPDLLTALINDPDTVVQCSSVGAMAIFGEEAVTLLIQVLTNPQSTSMQCGLASWGLAFVGAEAPAALRKAAQSKHSPVRAAAIAALGEQIHSLNDKEARFILLNALEDNSSEVRAEATKLIGRLNEHDWAQPLLIKRLYDSSNQVRKNAALSLMQLKSTTAINHLLSRKSKEKDIEVINVIKLAINQLSKDNEVEQTKD